MEEFRRVHRKMFSTFSSEEDGEKEKEEKEGETEINKKPNFTFKRDINKNEEKKESVETKPVSFEEKVVLPQGTYNLHFFFDKFDCYYYHYCCKTFRIAKSYQIVT